MHIEPHPIPRRPIGAILEARRREKAALAARCRSFGAIAEAMAHYARDRGSPLPRMDRPARWEPLGNYAGTAASMDAETLRASSSRLRPTPEEEHPHERHGAPARLRAAALTGAAS